LSGRIDFEYIGRKEYRSYKEKQLELIAEDVYFNVSSI